jgi:hypothetical protein
LTAAVGLALAALTTATVAPSLAWADSDDDNNVKDPLSVQNTPGEVSEGLLPLGEVDFTP